MTIFGWWRIYRDLKKGDIVDALKFIFGLRFVSDWTGLHRREVALAVAGFNALLSFLTNAQVVTAIPHLAGVQTTLLGLSAWLGTAGILDRDYANK